MQTADLDGAMPQHVCDPHTHTHLRTTLNYLPKYVYCISQLTYFSSLTTSYTSPSLSHTLLHTHSADRLTRKFHSLSQTHTHTRLRFHSDTPPSGSSHREGEGTKVSLPITQQHCSYLSTLLLRLTVQITVRQV